MEITLEKIELVKDRTGVSYKEAKEALEAADGNVVDAIIAIEEQVNQKAYTKFSDGSTKVMDTIKEYIKKGNVARIVVKKEEEVVVSLPVNAVIIGTVLAWWLTVIATAITLGTRCSIELVKTDGTVVDITGKIYDTADVAKEKGGEAFDTIRTKAQDAADKAKNMKDDTVSSAAEIKDIVADAAQDIKKTVKRDAKDTEGKTEEE
ncbi:MAG: DUF4342 domain-containing protein [Clostridiales bacterium]|nr:DUF4342 domain-containing protein [Clostridiales bacterium]